MNFDNSLRIKLVVAKENTRYALSYAWLFRNPEDQKRGELVALDGRAMVIIPVDLDLDDVEGPVEVAALDQGKYRKEIWLICYEDYYQTKLGVKIPRLPREEWGKFLDYRDIIPKEKAETVLEFDLKVLSNVARAVGCGNVRLEITQPNRPIIVRSLDGIEPNAVGVFMPFKSSKSS